MKKSIPSEQAGILRSQLDSLRRGELSAQQQQIADAFERLLNNLEGLEPGSCHAEDAAQQQKDETLHLFDALPSMIWRSGRDAKCDYFNETWLAFTGHKIEQDLGFGWAEGIHPEDQEWVVQTYQENFNAQRPFKLEYRLRHHSGEYRWVLYNGRPFSDAQGNFAGYIGTCYDQTERKNMEQALKESEILFKGLFENGPDGVIAVDEQGQIVLLNLQAGKLFGYQPEELIGQPIEFLMPESFQERHKKHVEGFMNAPRLRPMGVGLALLGKRKDGILFPADITLGPLDTSRGRIVLATIRDITEQRQVQEALRKSEARFHTIFEQAELGIELIDLDGRIAVSNPALHVMLGYSQEELRQKRFTDITHPADVKTSQELLNNLITGVIDHFRIEKRYLPKAGGVVWGRLTVSLFRDERGKPTYAIGLVENINLQKQMEAELAEVRRRLLESGETERLQLAQELHDGAVQDLHGVTYRLDLLEDALRNGDDLSHESSSQSGLSQLNEVRDSIRQVIATLRNICGELRPPTLAPFGLEKAIRSHADQVQELHPDLKITFDLASDGQLLSERVRLALFRIYQTLLANVIRHSHARHVSIRFALEPDTILLEIQDDGRGFKVPKRWVELARRGHFGLVGAVERAESIGGQLRIESKIGEGTRIRISVPRKEEEQIAPKERLSASTEI